MPVTVGDDIKLYFGPHTLAPGLDNLEQVIVDFIDGAEKRLEIAVQELESRAIAEAILRAEIERKVQVYLVLEADYLAGKQRPRTVAEAFESKGAQEENRLLAAAALRATCWVRTDFNPKIFHQKFIIRDREAVLTGSTNFTPTGVGSSPRGGNLNQVLTVNSRELARIYFREFREIKQGRFGRHSVDGTVEPHPEEVTIDGVTFKVCFAPDHNPEMEIMKWMMKARDRVD
ncbi:MAG: phospholipase D-like domain-containing protein, partial [Pseudomonadota bacterium]